MKTTTVVILAVMIAIGGTWAQGKKLDEKQIAGAIVLLLFFAAGEELSPDITSSFSWLVLAGITSSYGLDLFKKISTLTTTQTNKVPTPVAKPKPAGGSRGSGGGPIAQ